MNTRLRHLCLYFICYWVTFCPSLQAGGASKGLDAYREGNYPKAYKYLTVIAKKSKNKSEKASAIAMMGAAAVKMNKNDKAKVLFAKALKLDSSVTLSKEAAKDKSVDKIFSQVKNSGNEESDTAGGASGSSNRLLSLIPAGIGFFMEGKTTKGIIYGGIQLTGLVSYIILGSEITKANKEAESVGSQIVADKAANKTLDPGSLKFLDDNEKFVKATQSTQTAMIGVMLLGYGLGVIDGFFLSRGNDGKTSTSKPTLSPKSMAAADKWSASQTHEPEYRWSLRLEPLSNHFKTGATLTLNRSF